MNPTVEKVLERLAYERLLLTSGLEARKRQITLKDMLEVGTFEPRILQVLPAILLYKPKILRGIQKDLEKHPAIADAVKRLFEQHPTKKDFLGVDIADCQKSAVAFRNYLHALRGKKRNRLFNLRLNEEDWRRLESLTQTMGIKNYSEVIRRLIHESS